MSRTRIHVNEEEFTDGVVTRRIKNTLAPTKAFRWGVLENRPGVDSWDNPIGWFRTQTDAEFVASGMVREYVIAKYHPAREST